MNANPSELGRVRALAVELARRAGDQLTSTPHRGLKVQTKSSASDWVSSADRSAERTIVEGIRRTRPQDRIVGEEGSFHQSASGWTWVIDPLDGTSNYLRGYPGWAVSIAVECQQRRWWESSTTQRLAERMRQCLVRGPSEMVSQ